jgi:DNA-binding MarR family transcriptional regulator
MKKSDFDLQIQNQFTESKIVASLERISQAFRVLLWQQTKEFSLSPIQVQVLVFLLHHKSVTRKVSYLAEEFNLTKATISDTIKTLEHKKLISKEYDTEDTRSYIIHLTTQGKAVAKQISFFSNEIRSPIAKLSTEEKDVLYNSLLQILHHLNEKKVVSIQRMCLTCNYYQSFKNSKKHFCKLLNINLHQNELRIDCPEHNN